MFRYVRNNIYIKNVILKILNFKNDVKLFFFERELYRYDPIVEYDDFARVISKYKKKKLIFARSGFGNESLNYGHLNAIYEYAGKGRGNPLAFSKIEHGVNFLMSELTEKEIRNNIALVFQGKYKNEMIRKIDSKKLIFNIGPYIQYARLCYEEQEMRELKKEFRRTLLVYPTHSAEDTFLAGQEDSKLVNYIMDELGRDFDTVLVSVYWNDVDRAIYRKFAEKGAKLVSNGYRGDKKFIQRQRALLELSDVVCGNGLGTQIGYAYALDRPYFYIDSDETEYQNLTRKVSEQEWNESKKAEQIAKKAFGNLKPTQEMIKLQKEFVERYWGCSIKFSREEMSKSIELCETILKKTHGDTRKTLRVRQKLETKD